MMIRFLGIILFTIATALSTVALAADTAQPFPNILILYADDMGFGDASCNNPQGKIPTPNIDRLAKEGMRFTDGHSSSGICSPSRYALLTGRYHWRDFHGIVNSFGKSVFKPDQLTLPAMLRSKGYSTACIGKWHLGWDWDAIRKDQGMRPEDFDWTKSIPGGPLSRGFDSYFGDDVINFPPYCWIVDDKVPQAPDTLLDTSKWKKIKEGNWECRPGPMTTGWDPYQVLPTLTRKGVEYIESRKGQKQPFFLYFAFPSPHAPIIPNDEFDGKSKAGPFGDFVHETDHMAGQLLTALEKAGLSENTIVVFTADNGPESYAYQRDEKYNHWSAAPFRGLKRDLYEGGHHVPLVIRWPKVVKPGTVSGALVSQVDVMATFASVVNYDLPEKAAEDSHDMLPHLQGKSDRVRTSIVHNTNANAYAIREGDWLLVEAKDGYTTPRSAVWEKRHSYPSDDAQPHELFNLAKDIGQRVNVAAEQPELVKKLSALRKKIAADGRSRPAKSPSK